jgi:thioredoxin reductase
VYDIIVIGGGPAGASAAIFAARAGKKTLLLDADRGMTRRAMLHNHYGVPEIAGPDLVETGHRQAAGAGAELLAATAADVQRTSAGLRVETDKGAFEARHVILATGAAVDLAARLGIVTKPGTEPRIRTILAVDAAGRTELPGVWAAGTVAGVSVHTIVTAGDGARVAINVVSELNGARWVDHEVLR